MGSLRMLKKSFDTFQKRCEFYFRTNCSDLPFIYN